MPLTPEQSLCKYLNDYLFTKVWNSTEAEYRGNIIARCVSMRATSYFDEETRETVTVNRLVSVSNFADIEGCRIQLPDNRSYYLYMIPQTAMRGLRIRTASWQKLGDFLNSNCLDLRVTTKDGLWLFRNQIFVTGHPAEKAYLLAVNTSMFRRIAGEKYDATKLFVSVYYDSDLGSTVKSQYFYINNEATKNAFLTAAREANTTSVVLNGKFCQNLQNSQVYLGYYGEVITDPDKEFEFEIDLTDQDACRYYKSTLCNGFKYIIHIPKEFNPNRYVYTHNTVDFYLFPKNGLNKNTHGVFIHRFNTFNGIGQLTHQDFWISEKLIQAYMTFMETTDLILRVVVRRHSKTQTLIEDSNYIPLLYELSDEQILDHMEGLGPKNLSFWRAENLEKSVYMTLMFKSILTNPINVNTLSEYIDAIGYYNVLSAVCKRVNRGQLESDTQDFVVNLPVGLMTAETLRAHLWVNKERISPNLFTVRRNPRKLQADFHVTDAVTLHQGDSIITEVFEKHNARAERFFPTGAHPSIPIGDNDIRIFMIVELAAEQFIENPISRDFTCDNAYSEFNPEDIGTFETTINGKRVFTFNSNYYGYQFLVITKEGWFNVDSIIDIDDIRGRLCTTGPLTVDLEGFSETPDSTPSSVHYVNTQDVPIIWDGTPMVFLNGKELANGIDFFMKDYKTISGKFVAKVIHISNAQYFNVFDFQNEATAYYTEVSLPTTNQYRYDFRDLQYSYLLCTKGSLPVELSSAEANEQLMHIINDDPTEYGEIFTPTTSLSITVNEKKDVYLLTKVVEDNVEKFVISGLSLVQKDKHSLEVEFTTDDCFHNGTDFVVDGNISKRDVTLYYHDSLSMIHSDGVPVKHIIKDHYGYISTDDADIRNGGFIYHRGMCPSWLIKVLDQHGDKMKDIERLGIILNYLDDIDPHQYPPMIITDRSHHITSVIVDKVIADSTDGIINLSYDADEKHMLHQIEEYLPLVDEDPAMRGTVGEIIINNCGMEVVNGTYVPYRYFIRGYTKGSDRVWINEECGIQIRWYAKDEGYTPEQINAGMIKLNGRWVIENRFDYQHTYFYAIDDDGTKDPWELHWVRGIDGIGAVPSLRVHELNLRFIDIDPSYADVAYKDLEHRKCILQIMKGLLPEDPIKDGGIR